MTRGVVLWPDWQSDEAIRAVWSDLFDMCLPSLADAAPGRHRPHVSLVVAEELDVKAALDAVGPTPRLPIPFRVEMVGVFPGGVLVLPVVPTIALLDEHARVDAALAGVAVGQRTHTEPGRWSPHITCAYGVPAGRIDEAVALILGHLPVVGTLVSGGVEDGTTGEGWPAG